MKMRPFSVQRKFHFLTCPFVGNLFPEKKDTEKVMDEAEMGIEWRRQNESPVILGYTYQSQSSYSRYPAYAVKGVFQDLRLTMVEVFV